MADEEVDEERKRDDALKEAIRLEDLEAKKALGGGDMAATAYNALSEAADAAARGELSEARAREIIAKMAEASTGERLVFYTARSWAEDWLASKKAGSKVATGKALRRKCIISGRSGRAPACHGNPRRRHPQFKPTVLRKKRLDTSEGARRLLARLAPHDPGSANSVYVFSFSLVPPARSHDKASRMDGIGSIGASLLRPPSFEG